jgi:hypothetical protein
MKPTPELVGTKWPPTKGDLVTYHGSAGLKQGILCDIRWGLVWRDFILEDGRVIPEHKMLGCPQPPAWREANNVSAEEREACEERLVAMAESGLDPRDKEQAFWAEMNQYLAYTYMRFEKAGLTRMVPKKAEG